MPQIPRETTEQVLAATDIVDVIQSYIPVKRAGTRFVALCPFHGEKTPSFSINPQGQFFHCFGCGKSGDAITFVREYENVPFVDAVKKLAARAGISVREEAEDPREEAERRRRGKLLDLHREVTAFLHGLLFTPEARHAREYLKSRGFGRAMAESWMVGWMPDQGRVFIEWAKSKGFRGRDLVDCGLLGHNERGGVYVRFRDRLMFPIRNDHGDVIAFTGRQLREDPNSGKYINSPETLLFKKSSVLFALDRARKAILKEGAVLICEGQLDAISCHEHGLGHVVATGGTAFTPQHAQLIRRYTKNALLCFDADKAGIAAGEKAFRELAAANVNVRVVRLPAGEDPDSFLRKSGPDDFRKLLANAVEFFDSTIDRAQAEGRLATPESRALFARECAPLLGIITDPVSRDAMINHVATRLRAGVPELREAVARARRGAQRPPKHRPPATEDAPPKITAAPLDPAVGYLCSLALHSNSVQEWLGEQFETLHEAADYIEGVPLLESILAAKPDASSHASVNAFVAGLPEDKRLALYADATFQRQLPEDPVQAAEIALSQLSAKALQRRDERIKARLAEPGIPPDEMIRLLQEAKEVAELLKGIDQRSHYNDRLEPSTRRRKSSEWRKFPHSEPKRNP